MNTNVRHIILLFALSFFSALSFAKDDAINTTFFGDIAIDGYDPVAYFIDNKAVKGNKKWSHFWKDANWHFKNKENLSLFKQNPDKYAPQYGGYCAYAMSDGRLVDVDPDAFSIIDDKLYLNYSLSVQKHWLKEKDLFIKQADEFYPEMLK